jgi:hypothetical protein
MSDFNRNFEIFKRNTENKKFGRSNKNRLSESFKSPIYEANFLNKVAARLQHNLAVNTSELNNQSEFENIAKEVELNNDYYRQAKFDIIESKSIYNFTEINMNYDNSPDITQIVTGAAGLPASPWLPNPVSPGVGSVSPQNQENAPSGYGMTPNNTPFVGEGSQQLPSASASVISTQSLFKNKNFGSSS